MESAVKEYAVELPVVALLTGVILGIIGWILAGIPSSNWSEFILWALAVGALIYGATFRKGKEEFVPTLVTIATIFGFYALLGALNFQFVQLVVNESVQGYVFLIASIFFSEGVYDRYIENKF